MDHWRNDNYREKGSIRRKSVPVLICSLEIPIGLSRNWTRAYKISDRRLGVWTIAIRQRMWATMQLYISSLWVRENKILNLGGIQESYGILKHAANISVLGSRKHTKSYHILVRSCGLKHCTKMKKPLGVTILTVTQKNIFDELC
jgi:hypothetical protein